MSVPATCLGYPRIGAARELKKALESYWVKQSSREQLAKVAMELRARHWRAMQQAGIRHIPSNDFSLYDHVLDMAVTVGAVPARYREIADPSLRYFAMARGLQAPERGIDLPALEMTKWFDTNYHYIVPELAPRQLFQLDSSKIAGELAEARALGIETRPVLVGPVTLLLLSKLAPGSPESASTLDFLDDLLPVYGQLLEELRERGATWVQLDEPCLVLEQNQAVTDAYRRAFRHLSHCKRPRVLLTTYFGDLGPNLQFAVDSGLDGLHLDLVRAPEQLDRALAALPASMLLSLGVVDGRNVWRTDLARAHQLVRQAVARLGAERVMVAPSCSLLHVPVDSSAEDKLDPELKSWLAFAAQKLEELAALADAATSDTPQGAVFEAARRAIETRRSSGRTRNAGVRARMAAVTEAMLERRSPYPERAVRQHQRFALPKFPTTTIGSFPQTGDVRAARAAWRKGRMSHDEYQRFLEEATRQCVRKQEAIGLDVLVHGELERNDMVEYFGEQLEGFAFTQNGWVQSYGSRCVKPPILYGDVVRPKPMTVSWASFAQSLTQKPMKGMLTGPVTILQWSFVRDDQPRSETCRQIALALRDEVSDLEAAGIAMIQVDEPAIREGLPLKRSEWTGYLAWAVEAFRLATAGVRDDTQIHTHMCYSEFGDILSAVAAMDADVLSIETSRSKMELLEDFARFSYPNEIGPGVYDIHSPRVPSVEEMVELLERAQRVLPASRLWVNPDCGLKTRGWTEVEQALRNMVQAARVLRQKSEAGAG